MASDSAEDSVIFSFRTILRIPSSSWRDGNFEREANLAVPGGRHNYPNSEEHMNQLLKEATLVNTEPASYRIVQLGSPEDLPISFCLRFRTGRNVVDR